MWSAELDREVDPLEIEQAQRDLFVLEGRRRATVHCFAELITIFQDMIGKVGPCTEASEVVYGTLHELLDKHIAELEIISNLGEGDEYDLSNPHRRPDL